MQRHEEVTASVWLKHKVPQQERMAEMSRVSLGVDSPQAWGWAPPVPMLWRPPCLCLAGGGRVYCVVCSVGGLAGWLWGFPPLHPEQYLSLWSILGL